MMHEALRNDADCGGAHPHAQHYVPFASEITPLISAMVIARKGGGGGTGVRGRERSVVPESYASQLQSILSAYQGAKGKPPPKTGSDSACSQLKAMYPGGLPADFPTKAAVDRYQDEWAQSQAAAGGGGGGGEAEAAGAEAAHQPGAN